MSTGKESEGQVHMRRAVVTRRVVPLAVGSRYCLSVADSSHSRSQELLDKASNEGIPCSK